MAGFFNYFPTQMYANTAAVNIIAKVMFDESVNKNLAVFYPYTVEEGERPDQIAEAYYEDPTYDWVIYLSNNIIDPANEWPKDQRTLDQMIIAKYGSISAAQAQTQFYRINSEADDTMLSPAGYASLPGARKKYWSPVVGYNNEIINYERKRLDLISETNQLVTLSGTFDGLSAGDLLKQNSQAFGTVAFANTSQVVLKHVTGTWSNTANTSYVLTNTAANVTISSTSTTEVIPSNELVYWSAVTSYDVEQEMNESRKSIRLLSTVYLDKVEQDMKDLLST